MRVEPARGRRHKLSERKVEHLTSVPVLPVARPQGIRFLAASMTGYDRYGSLAAVRMRRLTAHYGLSIPTAIVAPNKTRSGLPESHGCFAIPLPQFETGIRSRKRSKYRLSREDQGSEGGFRAS